MLKAATAPEDVFGGVAAPDALKRRYHDLAKMVHPDGKKDKALAEATEAFQRLGAWHVAAKTKMANGTYGDRLVMSPVTLKIKKTVYTITRKIPDGDVANVFTGTSGADKLCFKICRNSLINNDLLVNERDILNYLWNEAKTAKLKAMAHIVKFRDSFETGTLSHSRTNVCQLAEGYYNLAEVASAYPKGLDLRDAAWMFNRVLGALLICQQAGVVHNAILPEHILIHPDKHNAKLCGWSYATRGRVKAKAIVPSRRSLYAPELLDGKLTTTATDLHMLAATIWTIIDAATVPRNIMGFFKQFALSQKLRPQGAWEVFEELSKELEKAFGPKKFRVFKMPTTAYTRV